MTAATSQTSTVRAVTFWVLAVLFVFITVLRVRAGPFGPQEWWGTINAVSVLMLFTYHPPIRSWAGYMFWASASIITYVIFMNYLLRVL